MKVLGIFNPLAVKKKVVKCNEVVASVTRTLFRSGSPGTNFSAGTRNNDNQKFTLV